MRVVITVIRISFGTFVAGNPERGMVLPGLWQWRMDQIKTKKLTCFLLLALYFPFFFLHKFYYVYT